MGQYSVTSLKNILPERVGGRERERERENERMIERKVVRNGGRNANKDGVLGFSSYNAMICCV